MWNTLSSILISTAVIAAALAAIANVIVALMNNARLRSIDKDKRKSELIQYRYTKLYSVLQDIEGEHGFVINNSDFVETLAKAIEKRNRYVELYKLARPLIKNEIRNSLDVAARLEYEEFEPIPDIIKKW